MQQRKHLVFSFSLIFCFCLHTVSSFNNVSFEFTSFTNLRNLTLLGDSHLRNGVIGLTQELGVPSSSAGSVIYNNPIPLFDILANTSASFSTRFSFSISSLNPGSFGDGLVFFISTDNQTLGSPGGYLGLVNSSKLTNNKFIAIEFDTKLDPLFNDPNENHVGLDIGSLNSINISLDPTLQGVDLKSGNSIMAWIDYKHDFRVLKVFLSYTSFKPKTPVLRVKIDLSGFFKEIMYVGFSASTEGSTEIHLIENWKFETFGFASSKQKSHHHNVTDDSLVNMVSNIKKSSSSNTHDNRFGLGFGIAGLAFFCVFLVIFGLKKWMSIRTEKNLKADPLVTGPRQFSYKELNLATKGFHQSRILGHGSFGNVYKAFFTSSGTISAVKRSKHSHEGKTEFLAELSIIASLRHKHLVQLQGWCVEKGELLLVYEYMTNSSLDKILYQESDQVVLLDWFHRLNIAIGLASAILYLHQECEQQVIHRDIKTSNIMLDGYFNAKLGDFGLARLMDHDKSPVSTLTAGTMGYLAPEYLQYGKATEKTDIFSYGVVILELACGRRPIEKEAESQVMVNLVDWVWGLYGEGKIIEAADKRLNKEFKEEEMKKLLFVGLSCANPDSESRPTMRKVLQILNGEAEPMILPKKKPSLTFSSSLSLNLDDIVSDCEM